MNYWLRHYGWIIEVTGILAFMLLTAYGINWISARMSQDVDAFQLFDAFADLYIQSATPLETQRGGDDLED